MTDEVSLFRQSQDEFTKRIQRIASDQWAAATPDDEWIVADLVAHLVEEHLWVPPLLMGHHLDEASKIVESGRRVISGLPDQGWDSAALGSLRAITEPGALDREVELSRGSTPARVYISEMIFDLIVHSWDLGVAIEMREPLPEHLVRYALAGAQSFGDLSGSGLFKPPVAVEDTASDEDKLIALTGRVPR